MHETIMGADGLIHYVSPHKERSMADAVTKLSVPMPMAGGGVTSSVFVDEDGYASIVTSEGKTKRLHGEVGSTITSIAELKPLALGPATASDFEHTPTPSLRPTLEQTVASLNKLMRDHAPIHMFTTSQPFKATVKHADGTWGKTPLIGNEELQLVEFYAGRAKGVICKFKPHGWGLSSDDHRTINFVEIPLSEVAKYVDHFAQFVEVLTYGIDIPTVISAGIKLVSDDLSPAAIVKDTSATDNPLWGTW